MIFEYKIKRGWHSSATAAERGYTIYSYIYMFIN